MQLTNYGGIFLSFFLHIHRFQKRYNAALAAILAPYQLSNSNWSLLHYTATHDKTTLSQMAQYWDVEKPTVSANVKALVQMKVLLAEQGEDKREKYLQLTAEGERLHTELLPIIDEFKAQLLKQFPATQQPQFEQALQAMESLLKGEK